HVGVAPSVLDLLDVLDADEVRAGRHGLLRLVALRDHEHPHLLAGAVRQAHGAPDDLVGVLGIDAQPHGHVHRLVEFRVASGLDALHCLARGIQLARLDGPDRRAVVFAVRPHQSTTSGPMCRAVPATMFIAASMSLAVKSGILSSAILRSCARVTLPTFWRFEVGLPFSIPASFFRSTAAGGVLVMNVNVRSLKIVTSTGVIIPCAWAVLALNCFTNSMMFTPCGPRAVPTGGAGVACPAGTWSFTTAIIGLAICPCASARLCVQRFSEPLTGGSRAPPTSADRTGTPRRAPCPYPESPLRPCPKTPRTALR